MRRALFECLNITPLLRPAREVPCVMAAKPFVKLQDYELGSAVGVLKGAGPSTISSTASLRNLDLEQSTVTWARYLSWSCPVFLGSASLLSQDVSLPHRPSARIAVQKRNRTPSPKQKGGKSYRLLLPFGCLEGGDHRLPVS